MGEWVNGQWVPSNNSQSSMAMFQNPQIQQSSPVIPLDASGNPIQMSYSDQSLDFANQTTLQNQGGLTNTGAANSAIALNNQDTGSSFGGENGWGAPAMQGLSSLANSWLGFQNLGVAKDQLNFQKDAYADQRADYNKNTAQRDAALLSSSK